MARNQPEPMSEKEPSAQRLYKHMRHPIVIALLIVVWTTPILTLDHFLLSILLSLYPLLANDVDENDMRYVTHQLKSEMKKIMDSRPVYK